MNATVLPTTRSAGIYEHPCSAAPAADAGHSLNRMENLAGKPARWALMVLWLMVSVLTGCGSSSSPPAPPAATPLLGAYREPVGGVIEFLPDGRYTTSGAVGGRFSVDGNRITLNTNAGKVVIGKRINADVVQFDDAKGPFKFYRVGSAAAQTAEATTPPPPAPEPEAPKLPQPDRSVPLSSYVLLENPDDIALLPAAFAETPLGDEEKLALLYREAPADAFARKDWIAQRLPAVNARLTELAKSRYIRVRASTVPAENYAHADPGYALVLLPSYGSGRVSLEPYNLDKRSFGIPCLKQLSLMLPDARGALHYGLTDLNRGCALPVPDEATARTIEAARVKTPGFLLRAEVYAFVIGPSVGSGTDVVPIRFDVSLLDPADPSNRTVLTTVPVEL